MLTMLPRFNVYLNIPFGKDLFTVELMYTHTAYVICLKIITKSYSVNSLKKVVH